jgi:hypothetical protein
VKKSKKTPQKFLALLATLNKAELADFGKYLRKRHSGEKIPMAAFRYFKQLHGEIVGKSPVDLDLAAQRIARSGAVRGQYDKKRLLDTFHELYTILKHFLLLRKLDDDSLETKLLWLKVQEERGLKEAFERGAYRLVDEIRTADKKGEVDYLKAMLVEFLDCGGHLKKIPADDTKLVAYSGALEDFYQISRLKLSCEITNQSNIKGKAEVGQKDAGQHGTGQYLHTLYAQVLLMLQTGDEAVFTEAKRLLAISDHQLDRDERKSVSAYLQNFCAGKIRQGRREYSAWSFEIYKEGLRQGLYLNDRNEMGIETFGNIISAGVAAGEFRQAAQFADGYLPKIPSTYSNEVELLSRAMLFFGQRQHKKALSELTKLESLKVHYLTAVRGRLLKIACMMGQEHPDNDVLQEIINCKNFLARNVTVHTNTRKAANNFLGIVNSICKRIKSVDKIHDEIAAAKELLYDPWLHELLKGYEPTFAKKAKG